MAITARYPLILQLRYSVIAETNPTNYLKNMFQMVYEIELFDFDSIDLTFLSNL